MNHYEDSSTGHASPSASEAWRLAERVRELHCLYQISRVLGRHDLDRDSMMQQTVDLLPTALQHPEAAAGRVTLYDQSWHSAGFRDAPWDLTCSVIARGEPVGSVTVCYLQDLPEMDEGPFLRSERSLLAALAQRLGDFIQESRAQQQFLAYQKSLRSLAARLSVTEQRERRRLAEGLHDRIGQSLALISIRLDEARHNAGDVKLRTMLAEIQDMTAEVIKETRTLTFDLCPPILYELGLARALEWLAKHFETTYGLCVLVEKRGDVEDVCEETRFLLFPAVRELLNNVVKHAGAREVLIRIVGKDQRISVSVKDDGIGFDSSRMTACLNGQEGFGLFNIREHITYMGGTVEMHSNPGEGTEVILEADHHV